MLWAAIGDHIHKNYEIPTPACNSTPFFPILSSLLTLLGSVLVLDQPSVLERTHWWRLPLAVDRIMCFDDSMHPAVLLGGRFLVGPYRKQLPLVEPRSEGRIRREASYIRDASVKQLSSLVMNTAHRFLATSYPLACSVLVPPLSVARWLLFSHHYVSSVANFFGDTMFHLSGAINVLLFLIIRLTPPLPLSQGTPRARNGTGTSRY
jgi:hypothetical protein